MPERTDRDDPATTTPGQLLLQFARQNGVADVTGHESAFDALKTTFQRTDDARIGQQHIDRTVERTDLPSEAANAGLRHQVQFVRDDRPATRTGRDGLRGAFDLGRRAPPDDDIRPGPGERLRGGQADPTRTAGDDDQFFRKIMIGENLLGGCSGIP